MERRNVGGEGLHDQLGRGEQNWCFAIQMRMRLRIGLGVMEADLHLAYQLPRRVATRQFIWRFAICDFWYA